MIGFTRRVRILAYAKIPLDINGVERALRAVAIGRKNHYGTGIARMLTKGTQR